MKKTWGLSLILLGIVLLSVPVRADEVPPGELGVLGRYTFFDDDIEFDDAIGFGARVTGFFDPHWGFEVDGAYTPTDGPPSMPDMHVFTHHGRLLYSLPLAEQFRFLAGLGWVGNDYNGDNHWNDFGVGALVGFRIGLGPRWAIRVDGTMDGIKNSADRWDLLHGGIQAGLTYVPKYHRK